MAFSPSTVTLSVRLAFEAYVNPFYVSVQTLVFQDRLAEVPFFSDRKRTWLNKNNRRWHVVIRLKVTRW